ncbi:transposase [Limnobacter humi]|uniref:Transposase n=2 Tax=Limnobacter humi TaxID=1778671 RepID=A0ABT1WK11_9BURK|nr:transposase [Limnobacter humi]
MSDLLLRQGFAGVGEHKVFTLMRRMGIQAIYCKPNTSKPPQAQDLSVFDWNTANGSDQSGLGTGHQQPSHETQPLLFMYSN